MNCQVQILVDYRTHSAGFASLCWPNYFHPGQQSIYTHTKIYPFSGNGHILSFWLCSQFTKVNTSLIVTLTDPKLPDPDLMRVAPTEMTALVLSTPWISASPAPRAATAGPWRLALAMVTIIPTNTRSSHTRCSFITRSE